MLWHDRNCFNCVSGKRAGVELSHSAHLVIVDDEPDIRQLVQTYLSRHGYAVSAVDGGDALRELMAERPVALAILDVNMPGPDGVSLAREPRAAGPLGLTT